MKQGWEIKKLGEVCNINYGTRVVQKKDGGTVYPVYGGGGATFKMDRYNREDCLIVSRFAMSNQCVRYVSGKFFLNDSGLTIESNELELSQPFLDKHITALNDTIYSLGKGVAQKNLDIKELKLLDIKFPKSLEEQERIVAELDCLSGVIERKREQLRELDALAQSIFYQMFGDPITNEKGWDILPFNEVADVVGGSTPKTNIEEYWNGDNYWATPAELHGERYIYSTERSITDDAVNKTHLTLLPIGTVLLSSRAPIGKVCITRVPMYCNQGFKNIICSDRLHCEYVYQFLFEKTEYLNSLGTGATFKEISKRVVEQITIPVPPMGLQYQFAERIDRIEQQKELIKKSISETETLFNARMDYYFN